MRGAEPVLGAEEPPGDERNPERPEVIVARHAQLRRGLVGAFGGAPDAHAAAEGKARQREPEDRRGRLRSGQSAHARQELPRELALAGFVRITGLGKRQIEREDLLGAETRVDGGQAREALDEKARADEEDERDRDLPGHEHAAQPNGAARRGGVAAPAPERPHRPGPESAERGSETEHEGGRQRPARGEAEHAPVDPHLGEARHVRGRQAHDRVERHGRERQARGGAGGREDEALGQELPRQPRAARPEGRADRDLGAAAGGPDEKQVRDVRARDQGHEPDGAEQHEQRGPHLAHESLRERPDDGGGAAVRAREDDAQPVGDGVDLGARPVDRRPRAAGGPRLRDSARRAAWRRRDRRRAAPRRRRPPPGTGTKAA